MHLKPRTTLPSNTLDSSFKTLTSGVTEVSRTGASHTQLVGRLIPSLSGEREVNVVEVARLRFRSIAVKNCLKHEQI